MAQMPLDFSPAAAGKRSWVCEELRVDGGTSKSRLSANPPRPLARPHRGLCGFHTESVSGPQRQAWPGQGLAWTRPGLDRPGLDKAWPGQAWPGQAWPGQAWPGQAWPGQAWPGQAWPVSCSQRKWEIFDRNHEIWSESGRHGSVWCHIRPESIPRGLGSLWDASRPLKPS